MLDTFELPHYILGHYSNSKITPLKLQKLLYYVKVWGIVAGVELYQGEFMRWEHGPVNADVYHRYKSFGRNPIDQPYTESPNFDGSKKELIDFIVAAYLPFSAISLSAMTHKESPWQNTPPNYVISHDKILDFYSQQLFAHNFNPFDPIKKPYFPVQSNSWYAYILDMTTDDVERHTRFSSFQDYQKRLKQAQDDTNDLNQALDNLFYL
ncbi:MAG: DUF4065 domain-containing protein [Anaerolineales bacterium]|nr:DUF4065 domain-containing protein [Anaerolineales bacterium]